MMASSAPQRLLAISDLTSRTGVPPATLRSWESRYGFPRPTRLPGGHRRYSEADVTAVLDVLRHRSSGLALEVAVRRATTDTLQSRSVYAELRRRHAELVPQSVSKATLVALSHAIEDECCARAQEPLLFAGFQREMFFRQSATRWTELARTAQAAVIFADFGEPLQPVRPGKPIEVALPSTAPLNREWIVLCDAPDLPACMAAVEQPGQDGRLDRRRRFEVVWTVDPRAVRFASRVAAALAEEYRPTWRPPSLGLLDEEPPGASADLRRAADLLNRMVGYLDAGR